MQSLADKSDDIVDFCGNITSNRAGAWSHSVFVQLFPIPQQSHAFSPLTCPLRATGGLVILLFLDGGSTLESSCPERYPNFQHQVRQCSAVHSKYSRDTVEGVMINLGVDPSLQLRHTIHRGLEPCTAQNSALCSAHCSSRCAEQGTG